MTRVHAPDPHRPRVRVLFAADGARLELPFERNLWEPQRDPAARRHVESVMSPVDPADYGIDPLTFLETLRPRRYRVEAFRTVLIAFGALAAGFTWQSVRTSLDPRSSPQRLVEELRLAQMAALLLTLTAGAYIGFAVVARSTAGRRARCRAGGRLPARRRRRRW